MIIKNEKYSYNDLTIIPTTVSKINSRKEVNPCLEDNNYPIFASPMSCVVSFYNYKQWKKNGITPIVPRRKDDFEQRLRFAIDTHNWIAVSLTEFKFLYDNVDRITQSTYKNIELYVLIDIANGHMLDVLELIKKTKQVYMQCGIKLVVMYGNVANPQTYIEYAKYGVDYIRVGIGSGHCCITSSNTSVHYPQASLVYEMALIKRQVETRIGATHLAMMENPYLTIPKIVADGGIRNYSDVIKALALGADYVMIGSLFGSFFESSALFEGGRAVFNDKNDNDTVIVNVNDGRDLSNIFDGYKELAINKYRFSWRDLRYNEELKRDFIKHNLKKEIYGMSTHKAQQELNGSATKTSEGISRTVECKYTIKQWIDNFDSYMRSAMSYCGKYNIYDFIGGVDLVVNSVGEQCAVNK